MISCQISYILMIAEEGFFHDCHRGNNEPEANKSEFSDQRAVRVLEGNLQN